MIGGHLKLLPFPHQCRNYFFLCNEQDKMILCLVHRRLSAAFPSLLVQCLVLPSLLLPANIRLNTFKSHRFSSVLPRWSYHNNICDGVYLGINFFYDVSVEGSKSDNFIQRASSTEARSLYFCILIISHNSELYQTMPSIIVW